MPEAQEATMSVFDNLSVSYRPVLGVTPCPVCGLAVARYGVVVHAAADAPVVGLDVSDMALCAGHAIRR